MKRIAHLTLALLPALAISILAGPAVSALRGRSRINLERHHILYDTVIPDPTDAPFGIPGELYDCISCHEVDTSSGTNEFIVERNCGVCHPSRAETVVVDVQPGSIRNSFDLNSWGILPVSILGSNDYDVMEIDVSSLLLEGQIPPLRSSFQTGRGGRTDLALQFSSDALLNLFGILQPGETVDLRISGMFKDGMPVLGGDSFIALSASRRKPCPWGPGAGAPDGADANGMTATAPEPCKGKAVGERGFRER